MATMSDPPSPPAPSGRLAEERRLSIEAAMGGLTTAIRYVANRNAEMNAPLAERLVALRDSYIAGRWQTADEQAFWPAYHAFVAGIGVPIDGLILSRRWTRCIAWVAAILSLAALSLLVVQLSFWAGLDSTIRQIDDIERQIAASGTPSPVPGPISVNPEPRTGVTPVGDGAALPDGNGRPLDSAVAQRCIRLIALHTLLSERVASERLFLLSKDMPQTTTMTMPETGEACLERASRSEAARAYVMGNARILRTARQDYVLPVLFGLLGTIAFILRSLAQEIRDARLTVTDIVGAAVRVPLGMLAGLAVGWVLGHQPETVFGQITPWALAFVAGYSVELLFTAMDRLIGAFTGDHPATGSR